MACRQATIVLIALGALPLSAHAKIAGNHGSNAYTIKGTFPQDKEAMLEKISWMRQHPEVIRPEGLRGF